MPESRTRGQQAADWIGWHLVELVAVVGGVTLAATVAAWLIVIAVVAGGAWTVAEVSTARRERALTASQARQAVTGGTEQDQVQDDNDREEVAR